jgi:alkylresorcinol/alkylpyrone synthase
MTETTPKLVGLATAVPPHILETAHVIKQAGRIFARFGDRFERMLPVFANTGIERRYSACPSDWFDQPRSWPERTAAFTTAATALFKQASIGALAAASLRPDQIDAIVTVSSTGIATPSIEARVMHEMGMRDDVMRIPVFGLGCAGGVTGLGLAAKLARAMPGKNILLCVIELCTLAFRPDEMTKSNIIATALFGDGAAAAIVSTTGNGPAIEHAGEHCWPGTIDVMGWRVDPEGFGAIFSRSIPELVANELRPVANEFLARHHLSLADAGSFSFHPGGTKVIQALETAFELRESSLLNERKILKGFGNMSAPTVLFVLEEALKLPASGRRFMGSLGPGFTASFVTLLH